MADLPDYNCPNCGAPLARRLKNARMISCDHCGTSSVLEDDAFRVAGTGGVMNDAPSLVQLGIEVLVVGIPYLPVGHARFSYGRGWWDEFWCLDSNGNGLWLSADEGDYALERDLPPDQWPRQRSFQKGSTVSIFGETYMLSEKESAVCEAVRGEFPEDLTVGERHDYCNFAGPDGMMASFESWEPDGRAWTFGTWVDPWEVTVQ